MLITAQIRAARAMLRWTIEDLSRQTGTSVRTIIRIESADGIPSAHAQTLAGIQTALEAAGIEFIGSPTDAPGVRLRRPPAD